jgi:hypothetical protein
MRARRAKGGVSDAGVPTDIVSGVIESAVKSGGERRTILIVLTGTEETHVTPQRPVMEVIFDETSLAARHRFLMPRPTLQERQRIQPLGVGDIR